LDGAASRLAEAVEWFGSALAAAPTPRAGESLALAMAAHGRILWRRGDRQAGVRVLQTALDRAEQIAGGEATVATVSLFLGTILTDDDAADLDAGKALLHRAVELRRTLHRANPDDVMARSRLISAYCERALRDAADVGADVAEGLRLCAGLPPSPDAAALAARLHLLAVDRGLGGDAGVRAHLAAAKSCASELGSHGTDSVSLADLRRRIEQAAALVEGR
ncbi:MAG: hypothetical protein WAT39_20700, partial [Planctomycetota bacterium]